MGLGGDGAGVVSREDKGWGHACQINVAVFPGRHEKITGETEGLYRKHRHNLFDMHGYVASVQGHEW